MRQREILKLSDATKDSAFIRKAHTYNSKHVNASIIGLMLTIATVLLFINMSDAYHRTGGYLIGLFVVCTLNIYVIYMRSLYFEQMRRAFFRHMDEVERRGKVWLFNERLTLVGQWVDALFVAYIMMNVYVWLFV